jgi:proteasome lid subunit RPN8/RPN11
METMRAHVESCAPLEACGLLGGKEAAVHKVFLITNQAHSPVMFKMEPVEQIRAFNWLEANGLDLVGIFHSHPAGPETLSATDIAEAAYEVVQIIWSRAGLRPGTENEIWQARGFWIENGRSLRVNLQITNDE